MQPIIAIIGRPNVGKSRLFNRIAGKRKAIVANTPGVTRDRHYANVEWDSREFIIVDTGGMVPSSSDGLEASVTEQSHAAIDEADVIICVFDAHAGLNADDREIVNELRVASKPVIFTVNKIDDPDKSDLMYAFYELGIKKPIALSAEHGYGIDELLDSVIELSPKDDESDDKSVSDGISVAVIGRPNVGKSTLINRLSGGVRVVANEMPGTTRDAIDVEIIFESNKYIFIDTAGIRRKKSPAEHLENFTSMNSLRTVDRADIVILIIDGIDGMTRQDLNLISFSREQGKAVIVAVNKWDKIKLDWNEYEESVKNAIGELKETPMLCISAKTGYNCLSVFAEVRKIYGMMGKKIKTAELNKILQSAIEAHNLPVYRGRQVRLYYMAQVDVYPPRFLIFCNYPSAISGSYRKYLAKKFSEAIGMCGIPIRVSYKKKSNRYV